MIVTQPREPDADGTVAENGGLEDIGIRIALAGWVLARTTPAEGAEHVGDGLNAWQAEAGPVTLVAGAGEHPAAARFAEMDGVVEIARVVDVEADLFSAEGFAGGAEEAVHDLLGIKAARCRRGVERAGLLQLRVGGALVGV